MKKSLLTALVFPTLAIAFVEEPWFPQCFEFNARAEYGFNTFRDVEGASPNLSSRFNTHEMALGLELTAPDTWDWQAEIEFADTTSVSFGYRSFALMARKLWLDDICGDCVSLTTGLSYRDASTRMRKALSTPYHGRANFEFHTAVGKEWSRGPYWITHTWVVAAIGQATSGMPWLRGDFFLGFNIQDAHRLYFLFNSYIGLGSKNHVDVDSFNGWGNIAHRSIDIGARYAYHFCCYGKLEFDYMRRVYAHCYPERVNFFILRYTLPFCPI